MKKKLIFIAVFSLASIIAYSQVNDSTIVQEPEREQKKAKTRKAILEAAVQLFSKKGFDKTSIDELAKEAGIGKGTIYTYFKTKTDILKAFCEDELDYIHSELASKTNPNAPFLDQIHTIFYAVKTWKLLEKQEKFQPLMQFLKSSPIKDIDKFSFSQEIQELLKE